jgi:hypothetical protein
MSKGNGVYLWFRSWPEEGKIATMQCLPLDLIRAYRFQTFHLAQPLKTQDEAVQFVNQRGFIYFWPISGIVLPSLWVAVAGDRPVADEHNDPGHVTWGWKDGLLGKRAWYYAKVLRRRGTMISLSVVPYFYALSENYGSPEEDYLTLYEQGRLTLEARAIYEALLEKGPLDTIALRQAARLSSQESTARFERALTDLQSDFKVLPVGVTDAGAWHYSFAYDIVTRHWPELPEQARFIGELDARQKLAETYFRSVAAAQGRDLGRLFGWLPGQVEQTLARLEQAGVIHRGVAIEGQKGEWAVLSEM